MRSYKLNIEVIIAAVGVLSLVIFSGLLVWTGAADTEHLGENLLHYGLIIAPVTILWVALDRYLWHTRLFQWMRKTMNVPPDLRGRWEGILENADGSQQQKFVLEVKQTLTHLRAFAYSPVAHSASILTEIASSEHEENFTLCFLWQGEIHGSISDIHSGERFHGYTMLDYLENEKPRELKGSYFTNRKGAQTRGGIHLKYVQLHLKKKFE